MLPVFLSYYEEVIFCAVYSAWFIFEVALTCFIPMLWKGKFKYDEKGSRLLLLFSMFFSLLLTLSFSYISLYTGILLLPSWAFIAGMIIMVSGIAFRDWAAITLGRLYSPNGVLSSGPYKLVRHPAYGGTLIIVAGLSLAFRSAISLTVALVIIYPILRARAKREEQLLTKKLGNEYITYSEKVKRRFIPFLV